VTSEFCKSVWGLYSPGGGERGELESNFVSKTLQTSLIFEVQLYNSKAIGSATLIVQECTLYSFIFMMHAIPCQKSGVFWGGRVPLLR
jgi:hypothetical protein